jgi:hypothetical protein
VCKHSRPQRELNTLTSACCCVALRAALEADASALAWKDRRGGNAGDICLHHNVPLRAARTRLRSH